MHKLKLLIFIFYSDPCNQNVNVTDCREPAVRKSWVFWVKMYLFKYFLRKSKAYKFLQFAHYLWEKRLYIHQLEAFVI